MFRTHVVSRTTFGPTALNRPTTDVSTERSIASATRCANPRYSRTNSSKSRRCASRGKKPTKNNAPKTANPITFVGSALAPVRRLAVPMIVWNKNHTCPRPRCSVFYQTKPECRSRRVKMRSSSAVFRIDCKRINFIVTKNIALAKSGELLTKTNDWNRIGRKRPGEICVFVSPVRRTLAPFTNNKTD